MFYKELSENLTFQQLLIVYRKPIKYSKTSRHSINNQSTQGIEDLPQNFFVLTYFM